MYCAQHSVNVTRGILIHSVVWYFFVPWCSRIGNCLEARATLTLIRWAQYKMNMRITIIFMTCILFISCTNEKDKQKRFIRRHIIGSWTIAYMLDSHNEPIGLMHNIITFDKNGEFGSFFIEKGLWKVEQDSIYNFEIYLISDNPDYNKPFDIKFIKDIDNKLLKLELRSSDYLIVCSKMLYNFDLNIENTNKLIELTKWQNQE